MASPSPGVAKKLTHAQLTRIDQVIGAIWSLYPNEADLGETVDALEAAGLSGQNRARLREALNKSRFVSKGRSQDAFRVNPKYVTQLSDKFRPIIGGPTRIVVDDGSALIPIGTVSLTRKYVSEIVRQINEGYVANHFDSVAVMMRRLAESLLVECYIHVNKETTIKVNGTFVMLDRLIAIFDGDTSLNKSRSIVKSLRKIKDVGDTAAHDRNYVTKKADIEDIRLESRRCISELATLAGL